MVPPAGWTFANCTSGCLAVNALLGATETFFELLTFVLRKQATMCRIINEINANGTLPQTKGKINTKIMDSDANGTLPETKASLNIQITNICCGT